MELNPGALVAGRYRVDRKVGSGGMGEVWAGEHVVIGLPVALKTLLPAAACDRQIVARFKREAHLLGRIRSDHVAKVIDFLSDDRTGLVLVMELVEGASLGATLESRKLSIEEAIDLGADLARALCDLHRAQVVHRDLKPDNVILEPQADGRLRAVIVDFGLGRVVASAQDEELTGITHADMAVGTIAYMAPEQLLSSRDVTSVSDIYALGAILHRAASGQPLFGGLEDVDYAKKKLFTDPPPMVLTRFDRAAAGLQAVVGRAVARRPADRFQSAREMLDALTELRAVAQAAALDLDASTEVATPISVRVDLRGMPALSAPGAQAAQPAAARGLEDEATVLDAFQHMRASLPSIDLTQPEPIAPAIASAPAATNGAAMPIAPLAPIVAPFIAPPPASTPEPPQLRTPAIDGPTLPRMLALYAIAAALIGGLLLGTLAGYGLAR